jgi:hypothetical protein
MDLVTDPRSWFVEFLVLLMLLDLFDLTFRVCGGGGAGREVAEDVDDGGQGVNQGVKLEDREFIEVDNATSILSSLLASVLASALPSANASILAIDRGFGDIGSFGDISGFKAICGFKVIIGFKVRGDFILKQG